MFYLLPEFCTKIQVCVNINQANSLLNMMGILRERIWQVCAIDYRKIHLDIDTTVETVFGNQQGGRKGHNTKYRGKRGLRPILCFIHETRAYFMGKLRSGKTIGGQEAAAFIKKIKHHLPGCVQQVLLRADGEFLSGQSIAACIGAGFEFIIANKLCDPPFEPQGWYRPFKRKAFEYNSCVYLPQGWKLPCRFVVMRIANEKTKNQGKPRRVHGLKMIAIFTVSFVPMLAARRIKLSPPMTKEPMWKT